ncbi:hypothetical protein GCM10027185_11410 [Spirosoma pulveris]
MGKWIENGVRLAWLVDPNEKLTYIYCPNQVAETKVFTGILSGEEVIIGFETVLANILEK